MGFSGIFAPKTDGLSWHVQEEAVQEALTGAHALILQAEALRLATVRAGGRYRALFAWLLTSVRRIANEEPDAHKHHFQTNAQALSDFIHGQLFEDRIGPQLCAVRCFLAALLQIQASAACPCLAAIRVAASSGPHLVSSLARPSSTFDKSWAPVSPERATICRRCVPASGCHGTCTQEAAHAAHQCCAVQMPGAAAGPLLAPTPGVQSLLKLFGCDPGDTPLHARLKQLRPSLQAVFAPVPQALSADARLVAHIHLATLHPSAPPRVAFKASQVGLLHYLFPLAAAVNCERSSGIPNSLL